MTDNGNFVGFVSNEHFLKCVKHVCDGYFEAKQEICIKDISSNGLDPFKTVFDIANRGMTFDSWLKQEEGRQLDKTLNNRIGEFHQLLLGGVRGWKDLGIGDESKLDLIKDDNSIAIELKNKENTVNADSKDKVRDKLERFIEAHPKAKAYWAYIINKRNTSGDTVWRYKNRNDERVRRVYGSRVYELVTGKKDALKQTWEALPKAINDLLKKEITPADMKKLSEAFQSAL